MVEAVRYPPSGVRGVGSGLARASAFSRISDYLQTADHEVCLLLQVEARQAVEVLRNCCRRRCGRHIRWASRSRGRPWSPGNPGHRDVQEVVESALTRMRNQAGLLGSSPPTKHLQSAIWTLEQPSSRWAPTSLCFLVPRLHWRNVSSAAPRSLATNQTLFDGHRHHRLVAPRHLCLDGDGAAAWRRRIMNLANGEILIAGAFGTFWFYSATKARPLIALFLVAPAAFVLIGRFTGS